MNSGLKQSRHERSLHRNQDVDGEKQFKLIYKSCQWGACGYKSVSLQKCGHAGKRSRLTGSTQQNCSFFPEGYFVNLSSADRTAFAFSWEKWTSFCIGLPAAWEEDTSPSIQGQTSSQAAPSHQPHWQWPRIRQQQSLNVLGYSLPAPFSYDTE